MSDYPLVLTTELGDCSPPTTPNTYHTYCRSILGCRTYPVRPFWGAELPVSSRFGVLTTHVKPFWGADLPVSIHSRVPTYPSVLTTDPRGLFHPYCYYHIYHNINILSDISGVSELPFGPNNRTWGLFPSCHHYHIKHIMLAYKHIITYC